jgi:DNA polymerase-3 subunit delta'
MTATLEKIRKLLASERSHAVLFYGAEGSHVNEMADALALGWLCTAPVDGTPCGVCRSCAAAGRSNHADLKVIAPKGKSAIIKISEITDRKPVDKEDEPVQPLQDFFRTPPLLSSRKVVIMKGADRMNESASNSLLKILEEPHPYAKLILTTTSLGDILPTILSRCINIPVEMTSDDIQVSPSDALIDEIAKAVKAKTPQQALSLSERLREASGIIEAKSGVGARVAHSRATFALTASLLKHHPEHPEWAQQAIEAHRRIVGNGNATLIFDSLFTGMVIGK